MHALRTLWTDKPFWRKLWTLAVPIIIQNFINSSLNMVDTLMIGAVGEDAVAAVGIANQVFYLYNLLLTGVAAGSAVLIAQYWGARQSDNICRCTGFALLGAGALGLVFTLLVTLFPHGLLQLFSRDEAVLSLGVTYIRTVGMSYLMSAVTVTFSSALRSTENTRCPMVGSIAGIVLNATLNYIWIFGHLGFAPMGVFGAALATVVARLVEMGIVLLGALQHGSPLRGKLVHYFTFTRPFARRMVRNITPVVCNEGFFGLGTLVYTFIYGLVGTQALAAVQIYNTVLNLFMVVCFSMGGAAMVMTGNLIGAGKPEEASDTAHKLTLLAFCIGTVLGITVFFLAPAILSLFAVSQQVRASTVVMLRIFAVVCPLRSTCSVLLTGVLRGGGDASYAFKAETGAMVCISIPLAYLAAAVWHLSIEWVMLIVNIEVVTKSVLCLLRLRSGKWMHNRIVASSARATNAVQEI